MQAVLSGKVPLVQAPKEMPPGVVERKDIEYGRVGDRSLLLDLYLPDAPAGPLPVLVFIHGGGWRKGDRADYKVYTVRYAQRGYAAATISYRLSEEAKFPAAIEDAKCAVRWVRANAGEYGFDPRHIAVIGGSAGGHISMMTGYTAGDPALEGNGGHADQSSSVQAVVNFYGPSDLTTEQAKAFRDVQTFLGATYEENPGLYTQASPVAHIDSDCPPTLIFHGSIDQLVPVEQSEALAAKLREAGVPCEYQRVEGWPHTMDAAVAVNDYCRYYLDAFLDRYVPRQIP
jgi:acetyl esterase/lipase